MRARPHPFVPLRLLLAVWLSWSFAASAVAAPSKEEMQARRSFAAGDWPKALDLFADLYAKTLHPVYLRNIGRCHQKMRQSQQAIDAFRDYLAKGKGIAPDERAEVEGYIHEMEALIASGDSAQRAKPNDEPKEPRAAPLPAAAPPLTGTATTSVTLVSESATPAAEDEGAGRPIYKKPLFWVAVGVVTVGAIAAAFLLRPGAGSDACVPMGVTTHGGSGCP